MIYTLCELSGLLLPLVALTMSACRYTEREKLRALLFGQVSAVFFSAVGFALCCRHVHDVRTLSLMNGWLEWRLDFLTAALSLLITFIASVIAWFAARSMVIEKTCCPFVQHVVALALTAGLLVASNSLIISLLCWHGISVILWRLVSMRKAASASAARVLAHHLCSDALFLAAAILLIRFCHTPSLSSIPSHLGQLAVPAVIYGHVLPVSIATCVSLLLVLSMSIKSALFPFNRWLLATIDAPTPLSGMLHAGVVNVSAIMAARMFPVLANSESALVLWGILAIGSSLIGTLASSADSVVKRKLAYSTVGQMGFMNLQLATGFVAAGVFHLIAHGLYKCNQFLRAASAVSDGQIKKRWGHAGGLNATATYTRRTVISVLFLTLAGVCYWVLQDGSASGQTAVSVMIAAVALATALPALNRVGLALLAFSGFGLLLALMASHLLAVSFDEGMTPSMLHANKVLTVCIFLFAIIGLGLPYMKETRVGQALYLLALNGFYLEEALAAMRSWRIVLVGSWRRRLFGAR
jgi:NADH:ubiquinone oxidoreductase subunit 5 (subunit L)/multisubunit Na+/H+ antiporter MnhA subunit